MGDTNDSARAGFNSISGSREAGDGTVTYRKLGKLLGGRSTNKDCTDFLHSQGRNFDEPPPCHAVYAPSASKAPERPWIVVFKKLPSK